MENSQELKLTNAKILSLVEIVDEENGPEIRIKEAIKDRLSSEQQEYILNAVEMIYDDNGPKIEVKKDLPEMPQQPEPPKPEKNGTDDKKGKKKKRKIKWYRGAALIVAILAALGIGIGILQAKFNIFGKLSNGLKGYLGKNDLNKSGITEIADTIPLDNNGIISITMPVVNRPLDKENQETFYSLPDGFATYYVYTDGKEVDLAEVTDDPRNNENVNNYQTQTGNGSTPKGYIGIQDNYAEFLKTVDELKAKILSGEDTAYSTALQPVDYQVPDLYLVPDGYELYSEDKTVMEFVKLAYIDYDETESNKEHFSKIYQIPEKYLGRLIVVTRDAYILLTKGDELRAQIVEQYEIYMQGQGNVGYEEPENRGR